MNESEQKLADALGLQQVGWLAPNGSLLALKSGGPPYGPDDVPLYRLAARGDLVTRGAEEAL